MPQTVLHVLITDEADASRNQPAVQVFIDNLDRGPRLLGSGNSLLSPPLLHLCVTSHILSTQLYNFFLPLSSIIPFDDRALTLAQVSLRCVGAGGPPPWSPASLGSSGRRWSPPQTPRRVTLSSSSSRYPGFSSRHLGQRWSPRTCPASGQPWKSPLWEPHPGDCLKKKGIMLTKTNALLFTKCISSDKI